MLYSIKIQNGVSSHNDATEILFCLESMRIKDEENMVRLSPSKVRVTNWSSGFFGSSNGISRWGSQGAKDLVVPLTIWDRVFGESALFDDHCLLIVSWNEQFVFLDWSCNLFLITLS